MIPSRFRLPFAGKYILSGQLSFLNKYRGVADALEIKELDGNAIVLSDSGDSFFDVETLKPHLNGGVLPRALNRGNEKHTPGKIGFCRTRYYNIKKITNPSHPTHITNQNVQKTV